MEKLPKFKEEWHLAASLQTPHSALAYEKLFIGTQIKKLRKKAQISQKDLAKKMGTTQSTVARMETGKQNFSVQTLVSLSIALGKKLHVLFK